MKNKNARKPLQVIGKFLSLQKLYLSHENKLCHTRMKKVKVFIEMSEYGYSAYMDDTPLDYSCIGEGKTVEETIADFYAAYAEMRDYYHQQGREFEEVELEFFYDTASFLQAFVKAFSLAGLERITGVNQTQLGHYLHGRSKPSRKTIERIENGVHGFAKDLMAIRFS